jgi:NAD(P)-dependent dehydrogenase (short-subunit alcohol dehydrogenase family)
MAMTPQLNNARVLVIGGSSGIGLATARKAGHEMGGKTNGTGENKRDSCDIHLFGSRRDSPPLKHG